ncbi:hypothetical protein AG1IA_01291 [Rhizoctonia solani AG-1 IA]|uniref:Uncharacterized protein n=1 Tax=Thanatephorus cucumeris (strain AG1-IA) TaxID=983506 RepID=L8X374_THACA|nr:hypothetical protein AG1IA_01291 [Rhizoctonia solani AG-1 IA]
MASRIDQPSTYLENYPARIDGSSGGQRIDRSPKNLHTLENNWRHILGSSCSTALKLQPKSSGKKSGGSRESQQVAPQYLGCQRQRAVLPYMRILKPLLPCVKPNPLYRGLCHTASLALVIPADNSLSRSDQIHMERRGLSFAGWIKCSFFLCSIGLDRKKRVPIGGRLKIRIAYTHVSETAIESVR